MNRPCCCAPRLAFLKKPCLCILILLGAADSARTGAAVLEESDLQPLAAQVKRLTEALEYLGSPLDAKTQTELKAALEEKSSKIASEKIQNALEAKCLFIVNINPEMRVKVASGPARPELVEQGWRQFLVKVVNESGTTAALRAVSPNAISVYSQDGGGPRSSASDRFYRKPGQSLPLEANAHLWLALQTYDRQPLGHSPRGLP